MTEPAATTPVGAANAVRGNTFYKSGPWLIVYGHGPESEVRAGEIAAQCAARNVDCDLSTADEASAFDLPFYTALIVVLPAATAGEQASSHDLLVETIRTYRARRPDGLDKLGTVRRWFEVGVVQVFDDLTEGVRPAVKPIQQLICQYHHGEQLRPFACYEDLSRAVEPAASAGESDHLARSIEQLRDKLGLWGIGWSATEIAMIRRCIEHMRQQWERPTFSDLRRPVPTVSRNRLDFLLDQPGFEPPEEVISHKKWMEGGQRVVTRVLEVLQLEFPHVHRPAGRAGRKGKQKDFQELYQTIRAAEQILTLESSSVP